MDAYQIKIIIPLITAHFLGDFILQTDSDVKQKQKLKTFTKHIILITSFSYLLLGNFENYLIPIFIFLTHSIIDFIKIKVRKDNIWTFLIDQFVHIAVLIIIVINVNIFVDMNSQFFWENNFGENYYIILMIIVSLILITKFSGILIEYLIKPLQVKIFREDEHRSSNIPQTGKIIGYLERFIILISVGMNVPAIIGFLITAKSILRYAEIKSENDKLFIEYILIGTLFSFALGISFSFLTLKAIGAIKVML